MPERLRCRQYASIKLQEVVFTVRPGLHGAIGKVLSSKNWFFRLRVERLFDTSSRISEFATALGLSDSGFCKAFRRVYGHSFYRWYQSRRLESIMENMARYEYSLRELAVKHGFNSVQHLGYFIKKSTGLSAGRLRREIQKEPARFLKAEDQQP
ncbi:MAG: helix-turn-helix domain-containing protein [Alistipes sp.]|nr:helix-turn-helix domain-containing protein [Alistipes sp.]